MGGIEGNLFEQQANVLLRLRPKTLTHEQKVQAAIEHFAHGKMLIQNLMMESPDNGAIYLSQRKWPEIFSQICADICLTTRLAKNPSQPTKIAVPARSVGMSGIHLVSRSISM